MQKTTEEYIYGLCSLEEHGFLFAVCNSCNTYFKQSDGVLISSKTTALCPLFRRKGLFRRLVICGAPLKTRGNIYFNKHYKECEIEHQSLNSLKDQGDS